MGFYCITCPPALHFRVKFGKPMYESEMIHHTSGNFWQLLSLGSLLNLPDGGCSRPIMFPSSSPSSTGLVGVDHQETCRSLVAISSTRRITQQDSKGTSFAQFMREAHVSFALPVYSFALDFSGVLFAEHFVKKWVSRCLRTLQCH